MKKVARSIISLMLLLCITLTTLPISALALENNSLPPMPEPELSTGLAADAKAPELTPWIFKGEQISNTKFDSLISEVVGLFIGAAVARFIPELKGNASFLSDGAKGTIVLVAGKVVQAGTPVVYIKGNLYYRYLKNSDGSYNPYYPVYSKLYFSIYDSPKYDTLLGSGIDEQVLAGQSRTPIE